VGEMPHAVAALRVTQAFPFWNGLSGSSYRQATPCLMNFVYSACPKRSERGRVRLADIKGR
jgi:hypothetical protein